MGYKNILLRRSFEGFRESKFEGIFFTVGKYITENYNVFIGFHYISYLQRYPYANTMYDPYRLFHWGMNYNFFSEKRFDIPVYLYTGLNYEISKKYFIDYFGFKLGRLPGQISESWQGSPFSLFSPWYGDKSNSYQNYERKTYHKYLPLGVLELHIGRKFHLSDELSIGLDLSALFTTPNRKMSNDTYVDLNRIDGGDTLQLILLNKFMNWSRETGGSIGSSFSLGLNYIF